VTLPAEPLIFEYPEGRAGRFAALDPDDGGAPEGIPADQLRAGPPPIPNVSELDAVRHFTRLSQRNAGIDTHFYPLGSCSMKYNPRVHEDVAAAPEAVHPHPLWDESLVQGALAVIWEVERWLAEISGFARVSLQPAAGAQSELGALMMIRRWHDAHGRSPRTVIVPDTSHGTNPASAAVCGLKVRTVSSNASGCIDLARLEAALDDDTAALMVTNPNTLGLFEPDIAEISRRVHAAGGLVYLDGANMNAMVGTARPADQGVDLMHFNLHKTFSTPHGGGGPGAGAIACTKALAPFLPIPVVERVDGPDGPVWRFDEDRPQSIGKLTAFYGNFGLLVRAYAYLIRNGGDGLREVSRHAVLNANYLRARLEDVVTAAYPGSCLHEVVFAGTPLKQKGITALDLAKRLLDYGFYAPTVYFPLIVDEAIMVEPTETESRQTLDAFADAVRRIASEDPADVKRAPVTTPVGRLDEVAAARHPVLRWPPQAG
jgi:glycine dehydrogenase subunit 2